jgi:acetyltransferase
MKKHYLNKVFEPQSVAVVGASDRPESVGGQSCAIFAKAASPAKSTRSIPSTNGSGPEGAYASINDIDHPIDLVVIAIPAIKIPARDGRVRRARRRCGGRAVCRLRRDR